MVVPELEHNRVQRTDAEREPGQTRPGPLPVEPRRRRQAAISATRPGGHATVRNLPQPYGH